MNVLGELPWLFPGRKERVRLVALVLAAAVGAALEAAGVGLVVPVFASVATGQAAQLRKVAWAVLLVMLLKNAYLVGLQKISNRFLYRSQTLLATRLFAGYLTRDYTFHLQRNSSDLIRNVNELTVQVFTAVVAPCIIIAAEAMVIAALVALMFFVDALSTAVTIGVVGSIAVLLHLLLRRGIANLGREHTRYASQRVRAVSQALGALKESRVLGRERYFLDRFRAASDGYSTTLADYHSVSERPRLLIESLAVAALIALVLLGLSRGQGPAQILPTVGVFALAGFRLMPSVNRIINSLASIRYHAPALEIVRADVPPDMPALPAAPTRGAFTQALRTQEVSYRHQGAARDALSNVSLEIRRGETVALVGPSGAGKSTLLDVLLGMLRPDRGRVLVDGKDLQDGVGRWQRLIGYVPQPVFLLDDTIRRNIAFGVEDAEIDQARLDLSLADSQLDDFVATLPRGVETEVGENGVRLSGGQRQRIGIARALYGTPEVLFMDEPTSALDHETEREIINAIDHFRGHKTVLIVAHRLSTVQHCDRLFLLHGGQLAASGTYEELLRTSPEFRNLIKSAEPRGGLG